MAEKVTLKLIHPRLGVCAVAVSSFPAMEEEIKQEWRYRYGKKYFECTIEAEGEYTGFCKAVVDIVTWKKYGSIKECSEKTGYHTTTIRVHCNNGFKPGMHHLKRFSFLSDCKEFNDRPEAVYSNKNYAA